MQEKNHDSEGARRRGVASAASSEAGAISSRHQGSLTTVEHRIFVLFMTRKEAVVEALHEQLTYEEEHKRCGASPLYRHRGICPSPSAMKEDGLGRLFRSALPHKRHVRYNLSAGAIKPHVKQQQTEPLPQK